MSEYLLVEHSEGGTSFRGYLANHGKVTAIERWNGSGAFVTVDVPDDGASREGFRLEMDEATADQMAKAIRRAVTEYRKRESTTAHAPKED